MTVPRRQSRLGTDEFVEAGDRGFAVDSDAVLTGPSPRDSKGVECRAEQSEDVFGSVREVVADAFDTAVIGHDTTAVAVDQATDKFLESPV